MLELPRTARIWRHIVGAETEWGHQESILADIRDISRQINYFSMISAQAGLKRSSWKDVVDGIPDALPRPGDKPIEPEEIRISTPEEMAAFFGVSKVGKPHGRKK